MSESSETQEDVTHSALGAVQDFLGGPHAAGDEWTFEFDEHLASPDRNVVSGVYILNPVSHGEAVEYRKFFHPNPKAIRSLPDVVVQWLLQGNNDPQGPRWAPA